MLLGCCWALSWTLLDAAVGPAMDPAMDPLRAEARALQAEIAALRRACDDLPVPWKEASRLQYVAPAL